MKIGFDAKRALNNSTGLGNHARILINALAQKFPEHEYLLFSPRSREREFYKLYDKLQIIAPKTKFDKAFSPFWRSFSMIEQLKERGVNIYHGLSNELPFNIHQSGIPAVVTIHDLIFLKHTQQYPFLDRKIYEIKTCYAAKHSNRIIAVSEETKNDLVHFYKTPKEKIIVIHPAVEPVFYNIATVEAKSELKRRYALPEKFMLNVSSFFPRKNQKTLIRAFDLIKDKVDENLILVGSGGSERGSILHLIAQMKLEHRIKIISGISNEELPTLYQLASVFVYPSIYEGFGAPVLEALCSRTPVITTSGGCMQEAGGEHSIYIDPHQPEEISDALIRVLRNESLRKEMIDKGYAHALSLTPEIFAEKTMRVYLDVT